MRPKTPILTLRPAIMFTKHLHLLGDVRSGKIPTTDFHFESSSPEDEEGEIYDINQQKRYNLITALMYDPLPTDESLLQELVLQEVMAAEMDWGLGTALLRSSGLLARFKNVDNVWLFTRAKCANFDTHCGFDYEFLVSAGIDLTYDMVDRSDSEWRERFYNIVGESRECCLISPEELNEFESNLEARLDNSLNTIKKQIDLAFELKEMDIAKEKVAQWKVDKLEWTADEAILLCSYERRLGNTEGEIAANELAFSLESREFMIEILLSTLCELYIKMGRPLKAWERIQARLAVAHLEGLCMIRLFELVSYFASAEDPLAVEVFACAMRELSLIPPGQMGMILAATAKDAARKMGDEEAYVKIEEIFQG